MQFIKSKRYILLIIILIIGAIFVSNKLYESRYGYIVKGPTMKCEKNNYVKLNDGRIFFVGHNIHRDKSSWSALNGPDMGPYKAVCPSEIYDPEKNTFEEVNLPEDFYYLDKAVLLKDGKILFTNVKDLNRPSEVNTEVKIKTKWDYELQYGSMAIYNLETNKIEKSVPNKISKYYDSSFLYYSSYLTMNNGKVLGYYNLLSFIGIYDINNNTSELIKIKEYYSNQILMFQINNDEVIIITSTENPILKYNDKTRTVQEIGKFKIPRDSISKFFKINNDMVLVVGGRLSRQDINKYNDKSVVEIYNLKTKRSEIITMPDVIDTYQYPAFMTIEKINEDNILIASGVKSIFRPLGIQRPLKTTEILNLKTKKFTRGPRMKRKYGKHQAIKLDNGDILISSGLTTQIFKKWKVWR